MAPRTSVQLAWLIRRHAIEMTHLSGGSHIGAILSVADILGVLYADVMHVKPDEPEWADRDRFVLSKGHAGAAIYAALAETGFFPVEELKTHYQNGSRLSGHVSHHLPGVDFSTGSLGHGLSAAAGMAYAAKKDGRLNHRVFAVLGDGECDEGSVWEAALFANHFRLQNLTAIVDRNRMQSLDFADNTLEMGDFAQKWRSFGWHVQEINGNSHDELRTAFALADRCREQAEHKPSVIIADTVKGFGIPFMENDILWHYRFPHEGWEYEAAVNILHQTMPEGVADPYTPEGFPEAAPDPEQIGNDRTMTYTWHSSYPENARRVDARPASREEVHRI